MMWEPRTVATRDGDGWVECDCGNRHWGKHGAAGLLLIRDQHLLLQHRAPWVHNGDTWGVPGGARDSHETIIEAAVREAVEETGIDPTHLQPITTFSDLHGNWRYDTVLASATSELVARELNDESHEVRWVHWQEVTQLDLHPSFAKTWPQVLDILNDLIAPA
jgi:8-oxo-dGTP diphosphatase